MLVRYIINRSTCTAAVLEALSADCHSPIGDAQRPNLSTCPDAREQPLLQAVDRALVLLSKCKLDPQQLEDAFKSMESLQSIAAQQEIVSVECDYFDTFVLAFHHSSPKAQLHARTLVPSFFLQGISTMANPHINIVEYAVAGLRGVMLVSFRHMPTTEDIETVRVRLHNLLRLTKAGAWTVSKPWHYNSRRIGALFRPDGMVNFVVVKENITGLIKAEQSKAKRSVLPVDQIMQLPVIESLEPRPPRHFVIWIRQSRRYKASNIGKQMWTILSNFPTELLPFQVEDALTVAIEFCSSLGHSWSERTMTSSVLKHVRRSGQQPFVLFAWPDRVTRRSEDVDVVRDEFEQVSATWMFRGSTDEFTKESAARMSCGPAHQEDRKSNTEWFSGAEQTHALRRALSANVGTEQQTHFYSRLLDMATRILDAGPADPTVRSVRDAMTVTMEKWGISTIVAYCRVSPGKGKTPGCTTLSLERQVSLLRMFCPPLASLVVVREDCSSAYEDTDRLLVSTLAQQEHKCCIFSVSLDRILRRSDALPRLRSLLAQQSHIGVCFLWDTSTKVAIIEGLTLRDSAGLEPSYRSLRSALLDMRRAPPSRGSLPVFQPIIWSHSSHEDPQCGAGNLERHLLRHVHNAELHCQPYTAMSKSELTTKAPEQLLEKDAELLRNETRDWSSQRQKRWLDFMANHLRLRREQLEFLYTNLNDWSCSCHMNSHCNLQECMCDCEYCRTRQQCSCSVGSCVCPSICNCNCSHCQHSGPTSSKASQKSSSRQVANASITVAEDAEDASTMGAPARQVLKQLTKSEANRKPAYDIDQRQCCVAGCTKMSSKRSWKRYLCAEHDKKRLADELTAANCLNRACLEKRTVAIPYCSLRCYEIAVKTPQRCKHDGCRVPCPPELKSEHCIEHRGPRAKAIYSNIENLLPAKQELEAAYKTR